MVKIDYKTDNYNNPQIKFNSIIKIIKAFLIIYKKNKGKTMITL